MGLKVIFCIKCAVLYFIFCFCKDSMILYFHFLQKDLKIVYLFQQQRFSSSTMLIEHSLKESPRMYCQGRMQPHAFFPPLWASQQSLW